MVTRTATAWNRVVMMREGKEVLCEVYKGNGYESKGDVTKGNGIAWHSRGKAKSCLALIFLVMC